MGSTEQPNRRPPNLRWRSPQPESAVPARRKGSAGALRLPAGCWRAVPPLVLGCKRYGHAGRSWRRSCCWSSVKVGLRRRAHRLFTVGFAAVAKSACWRRPHAVAARDRCPLRQGVALTAAEQASWLPRAGLVHQPRVRSIKNWSPTTRWRCTTWSPMPFRRRGRRGCRPGGGAGSSVRRGLASGAVLFGPVLFT